MRTRLLLARRSTHGTLIGGAWLFVVMSLVYLAWAISVKWANPSELATVYQTTVDGQTYRAWGLSYSGAGGAVVAWVQAALVVTAATLSVLRRRHLLSRIGHVGLVAWGALWLVALARVAAVDEQVISVAAALIPCALAACTFYRAVSAWPRREPIQAAPEPEAGPEAGAGSY